MSEQSRIQVRTDGDESPWEDVGHSSDHQKIPVSIPDVTDGNSIGISAAGYSLQAHFETIAGWTESDGADGIAVSTDHRGPGTYSIEFDKIAGNTTAMISKIIDSLDMSAYSTHAIGHVHTYVSDLTNVDYVFVRMGTDASNYWEWQFPGELFSDGWNDINAGLTDPTSQTGAGLDMSANTWMAFGVKFDAAANTLANIRTGGWSIKRVLETTQIVSAEVQVNSPFLVIKDRNSNNKLDIVKGASKNYLYSRHTDGSNVMPTGDSYARVLYVKTAPNERELAGNTTHVKKYYTYAGAVTDGIVWSPASGKRWYITDIFINVSVAATVTLEDDTAGGDEVVWKAELATNSGWSHSFTTPLFSEEDAADLIITTDAGNVYVMVTGYEI